MRIDFSVSTQTFSTNFPARTISDSSQHQEYLTLARFFVGDGAREIVKKFQYYFIDRKRVYFVVRGRHGRLGIIRYH